MALPTTNLTFHVDASVSTDLWASGGIGGVHPTDGGDINSWDDVEHADIQAQLISVAPIWRSTTPLMLNPCADYNGTTMGSILKTNDGTTNKTLTNLITNIAFTVFVAIYGEGITSNAAAAYDNDPIWADAGGYHGIFLKNSASPQALFYNWDTNEKTIPLSITLNASHVLMFRHASGNQFASIDNGTETSIASGTTGSVADVVALGQKGTKFYNGRIGEMAVYNAALSGTPFTDAMSYFMVKWITGAVAASEVEIHRTALCTPVRIG